MEETKRQT